MDSITLSSPSDQTRDDDVDVDDHDLHEEEEDDPAASTTADDIPDSYNTVSTIAQLNPSQNELFFQNVFEIGRQNKVLNPSKMRATYGKLMHLLQDAQSPTIAKTCTPG